MSRLFLCSLLLLLAGFSFSPPALADKRVALVVGNSNYVGGNVPRLANPEHDARLMAETLRSLGFKLVGNTAQIDLNGEKFRRALQDFGAQLEDADVGLFYYAGHGVQVRNTNYLIPIDANPKGEADVGLQMLDINLVLDQMVAAGTRLKIVILDACRNNPFTGERSLAMGRVGDNEMVRMRDISGGERGLAQMQAPKGTLISFASQPGQTARDGPDDGDSPFTKALAETIRRPGLGIFETFNEVSKKVEEATKETQEPWVVYTSLDSNFHFVPPTGPASVSPATAPVPAATSVATAPSGDEIARKFEAEARVAAVEQGAPAAQRQQAERTKAAAPAQTPAPVGLLSPERERALKPPDRFKECENCPEMVTVPAGAFVMGSPASEPGREAEEGPQQQIVFGHIFAVGRSAVTFDEWNACVAEGGCNAYRPGDYGWGTGKRPVINVSWSDAQAYVKWLAAKTGAPYRLLSEAEREYVTRGCASLACPSTPFWFGTEISPERANYDWRYSYAGSAKAQAPRRTVATDASEANPFGLFQVHGNVREWVEDCWNPSLSGLSRDGAARTTGDCTSHVVRGGSWADEPKDLRSAKRGWEIANERRAEIGFRVARTLQN